MESTYSSFVQYEAKFNYWASWAHGSVGQSVVTGRVSLGAPHVRAPAYQTALSAQFTLLCITKSYCSVLFELRKGHWPVERGEEKKPKVSHTFILEFKVLYIS